MKRRQAQRRPVCVLTEVPMKAHPQASPPAEQQPLSLLMARQQPSQLQVMPCAEARCHCHGRRRGHHDQQCLHDLDSMSTAA